MPEHSTSTKVFGISKGLVARCWEGDVHAAKGRHLGHYDDGTAYYPNHKKAGTFGSGNIYSISDLKFGSYSNGTLFDVDGNNIGSYIGDENGAAATYLLWPEWFANDT